MGCTSGRSSKPKYQNQVPMLDISEDFTQFSSNKYRVVRIQKLARKSQCRGKQVMPSTLIQQLLSKERNSYSDWEPRFTKNRLLFYQDTGSNKNRVLSNYNNFFNAFLIPYKDHGDILLVPDDIWLMIILFLSKYIDDNAEKLRHHFVKHQNQMKLTISQYAKNKEQSLKLEKDWKYFFQEIIKQIQKNTLPGIVDQLSCNFSTTNDTYKLLSSSVIMSSFKKYFSYERCIIGCGINNIYFQGTREDWVKVRDKLKNLIKYDLDGVLKKYVQHVEDIINNFIKTFDGKPDVNWWNRIMATEQRRLGSLMQKDGSIEGWILHFYGIYQKIAIDKIPKTLISVPIVLENKITGQKKQLELKADWVSVSKINEYTYKPDIGVAITQL